uniref:glucuronosyltransferase n=1 Tax=Nippostrongylus brasiliensis TaxID=27835 RepID=A0A0N4Y8H3_NIPBR
LLILSICTTDSYKFLVYSPIFGYSHQNYLGSIADVLTEAGHDVTMLMPIFDVDLENKTGVKLTKKIIKLPPFPKNLEIFAARDAVFGNMWISEPDMRSLVQLTHNFSVSSANTCEVIFGEYLGLLNEDQLLKQLEDSKFDVGIAEPFTMCSFVNFGFAGIFEELKIPATIAALSVVHLELISHCIGEPSVPSYVPGNRLVSLSVVL